jgi:hypothetical protein
MILVLLLVAVDAFQIHPSPTNHRNLRTIDQFLDIDGRQILYKGLFSSFDENFELETMHHTHNHAHEHIAAGTNDVDTNMLDSIREQQFQDFQGLLHHVMMTEKPEHIPSLLGNNIQIIMSIQRDQIERILLDAIETGGIEFQEQVSDSLELILGFAEEFVNEMKTMNDEYKQLLGRILHAAKVDEDTLDELLEHEINNLSPGFVRHLEGECHRIANAPTATAESRQLLQVLQTIRLRVIEELGKSLGDEAMILGQLLGYDDPNERMAVLQAGLGVRGLHFAKNLWACTEQVVADLDRLGTRNSDPELVRRVQEIYDTVGDYVQQQQRP